MHESASRPRGDTPSRRSQQEGIMARTPAWDPFTTLARLDQDFDALVRHTWGHDPAATAAQRGAAPARPVGRTAGYVPAIEMRADGADVVITLELPGVDVTNDVDIE